MLSYISQRIIFFILIFALLAFLSKNYFKKTLQEETNIRNTPSVTPADTLQSDEILAIKESKVLDEQVEQYTQLIERVGPEQAQEELNRSGLPFDGQSHLLNHTVGDWLYEKYKTNGLIYCKDYFLSSCYHGFVIHAVADGGITALKEVMDLCWQSGEYVATQCAHAIGHGFLAWEGYASLLKALKDCDQMAQLSDNFPLYNCHDGVFMENIWAVHESGKPSKDRWVKDNDPVYPCNEKRIPFQYIQACWSNQPMRMFQMFRGDFAAVAGYCLGVVDKKHQETCFDGLARQIHPESKGSAERAIEFCHLMPSDRIDPCIISVARAAFSVGDRQNPFILCESLNTLSAGTCFRIIKDMIKTVVKDRNIKEELCNKIPFPTTKVSCLE